MKNCTRLTKPKCPVCGCRKIRIVTDEIMRCELPVRAQTGVMVVDAPTITLDLPTNTVEPTVLPAICNNPECGAGAGGPCEFTVLTNSRNGGGKMVVLVRKGPVERMAKKTGGRTARVVVEEN